MNVGVLSVANPVHPDDLAEREVAVTTERLAIQEDSETVWCSLFLRLNGTVAVAGCSNEEHTGHSGDERTRSHLRKEGQRHALCNSAGLRRRSRCH